MADRIAVLGVSGSGKSTLARRLGDLLTLPVFHMDKMYWTKDWQRRYPNREDFTAAVAAIANQKQWILDGMYSKMSNVEDRLEKADTIIYLDIPKWKALYRVYKRALLARPSFDKEEGANERVRFDLWRFILRFPAQRIRNLVLSYANTKKVYILKNEKDTERMVRELSALRE